MATPSSSTTTPSPPMPYLSHLSHAPGQQQASMAISQNEIDREQRNKAVQKFLARAEISMVREFRSHQTRPPRGDTPGPHGMPIHSLSIYSTLPDVINVLLISKSETISPLTHHSHRLLVPYERVFLMLRIRLLITFRTSLCVIWRHSLRTRAKQPPSAVQLPPSVRLLGPTTITTIRLHRVKA